MTEEQMKELKELLTKAHRKQGAISCLQDRN